MKKHFMFKFIKFFFLLASVTSISQTTKYPKDDFINPMGINLEPSGTFGELRGNHFHSGLDFKTQKKEGFEIYAVADGFISRIKYSTFGYGKALYVTHPNGYTSVYAHLQNSAPFIEKIIKEYQYKNSAFEVEIFPKKGEIPVKKGQLIAFSGNSGGSAGPHLHFEYRNTATEEVINPLLFGLDKDFKDTKAPLLNNLVAYTLTDSSVVNKAEGMVTLSLNKIGPNSYVANKVAAKGTIGLGINSYDMYDNHFNKNGLYKIAVSINGSYFYNVTFDSFAFAESRYINSYIDYGLKQTTNEYIQKLFFKEDVPLSLISHNKTRGIIDVKPNDNLNVQIKISDIHGNTTDVTIPITYSVDEASVKKPIAKTDYFLNAARENIYTKDNVTVTIPKNTFLEDFYLDFDVTPENAKLKLHKDVIPAYQNITIEFDVEEMIKNGLNIKKAFIASIKKNTIIHLNTTKKANKLIAKTKVLGNYQVITDEVKPRIFGLSFKEGENLDKVDSITAYISDDLSGIKTYEAFLNGKWILMDYDYKTKSLIHYFSDDIYEDGKNLLKIIVSDKVGNTTILDSEFYKTKNK